jgi:hypothetical protein
MKKITLAMIVLFGIITTSCTHDNDNSESEFKGNWSGIYTGDIDNGTWEIEINSTGEITGIGDSNFSNLNFNIEGNVEQNGELIATFGDFDSEASFIGQLNGNSGSGTWSNPNSNINGDWQGNKE